MSARTTSDEKRDAAKEKLEDVIRILKEAQELISKALDKETWGSDHYRSTYTESLEAAEIELAKHRLDIKRIKNKI